MTTSTLTDTTTELDLILTNEEIDDLWDEDAIDTRDQGDDFYKECLKAADYLDSLQDDFTFLQLCYWRLSCPGMETVTIDDSHVIFRGEETKVSVYDTLDGFYLALSGQDGCLAVKLFPYGISALEATTLVIHYGGCPVDREDYLEAVQYDLGISYTPESWDGE